ncbi:hypothetical protein BM221_010509 [Beauveria bassiana]|uniref:Uncharacterized protein n=1 Tax=Beauveria bassiana TaxID=176275 RepID=A0A2N6N916_BEABA|nr:hypothetical protein BM221_010773 [Beauveria bassiana]PMB63767.1 hypothetical protein BM221_010509 [Beauveria bassiana]
MLLLDELEKHRQLESVTLRYYHSSETVSYEWIARDGRPSDCWMTEDGRVYLPADIASVLLTEFFHHEIVNSRKTQKMVIKVDGEEVLAGEEHGLA